MLIGPTYAALINKPLDVAYPYSTSDLTPQKDRFSRSPAGFLHVLLVHIVGEPALMQLENDRRMPNSELTNGEFCGLRVA